MYIIDYVRLDSDTLSHCTCPKASYLAAAIEAIVEEHGEDCIVGITKL